MLKIGFCGLGSMSSAILRGLYPFPYEVYGYNRSSFKTEALAKELGLIPCVGNIELAQKSDVLFLGVKPQVLPTVLTEIAPYITSEKCIITIAAGKDIAYYQSILPNTAIIRVMPNLNVAVRKGVSALCASAKATPQQIQLARSIFEKVGSVTEIDESLFPAFSAVAGASPAFSLLYMDALKSAAIKNGFSKETALALTIETLEGTLALLKEKKENPNALIDQITSPAGTTIEGIHALKRNGFESSVHQAVDAVIAKDKTI